MHMLPTRSVMERGVQRVAGMLGGKLRIGQPPIPAATGAFPLVSWCPGAKSRRADEDARRVRLSSVNG